MRQLTIADVDDDTYRLIEERARKSRRTIEAEARAMLADAARIERRREFATWAEEFRERLRASYNGDSTADIRAERDSR
jgi:plasmid stability protein